MHPFILEKFQETDFEDYYALVSDERVMKMITEHPFSEAEARERYQKTLGFSALHPFFGSYKILDAQTGAFIGFAKIEMRKLNAAEVELGYMLLPAYWGKGIGSAVSKKLVADTLKDSSIERILAIIDPLNDASRKILTNNGFISEGKELMTGGLSGELLIYQIKK